MLLATGVVLCILAILAILQVLLIAGLPLGHMAWGGQHKVLPPKLRIGSAFAIVIYLLFGVFVLSKSGLWVLIPYQPAVNIGLWIMTVYLGFGTLLNAISRSKLERLIMTPTALVLTVCFLIISLG